MRNIWITSDTHFSHNNILKFETDGQSRGQLFKNIHHMNSELIDRWNSVVKQGDKVYHLGDVSMGNPATLGLIMNRLNGSKRLIVGNHDDVKFLTKGGWFQKVMMWRIFKEHNIVLSHVPLREDTFRKVEYNVHGHIHYHNPPTKQHINVCVERTDYTPVHIEEVINFGKAQWT